MASPSTNAAAGASTPSPTSSTVSSRRFGNPVRVGSTSTASRARNDSANPPTGGSSRSNASVPLPARSPSESSASSGSRASSRSYRSTASSSERTREGKPFEGVEPRAGKKRPLGAHNAQSERPHAKQQRLGEKDRDGELSSNRWMQRRSPSPPYSSDRGGGDLVRARLTPPPASSLSSSRYPPSGQQHRTARMAEYLFQHSTALLHHASLENDVRAEDLREDIRRQREKQDKYDRKMRSLLRELETLHPQAAAAHARGESIALVGRESGQLETSADRPQPEPEPTNSTSHQAADMLIPPSVPEKEARIRSSTNSHTAQLESFSKELRHVDYYVQTDR